MRVLLAADAIARSAQETRRLNNANLKPNLERLTGCSGHLHHSSIVQANTCGAIGCNRLNDAREFDGLDVSDAVGEEKCEDSQNGDRSWQGAILWLFEVSELVFHEP